jgi:hypothetical protein
MLHAAPKIVFRNGLFILKIYYYTTSKDPILSGHNFDSNSQVPTSVLVVTHNNSMATFGFMFRAHFNVLRQISQIYKRERFIVTIFLYQIRESKQVKRV